MNEWIIISTAIIGAIITNLICLRQSELKALIAYSSIRHMGLSQQNPTQNWANTEE